MSVLQRHPHPSACVSHPLPERHRPMLEKLFTPHELEYIRRVLTTDELCVVADPADALIVARIKRMSIKRLRRYDKLMPHTKEDQRIYRTLQIGWLRDEEHLLKCRLGRCPTHAEFSADFEAHHNGLRFRAYFALKYPQKVRHNPAKTLH